MAVELATAEEHAALSAERTQLFLRRDKAANIVSSLLCSLGAVEFAVQRRPASGAACLLAGAGLWLDQRQLHSWSVALALGVNLPSLLLDNTSSSMASFVLALRVACVVLLGKVVRYSRSLHALRRQQRRLVDEQKRR